MPDKRPNFIMILTDDQGYGDLSCMGATDFRTPHLDRLAGEGVRFTSFYSNSPVCSPSRASVLSGRYPGNAGVRSILAGHRQATGLQPSVPTMPSELKKLGYQTAMFGKWHLGLADECRPHSHGFDHWMGFLAGCIDFYSHIFYWGMNKPGPGRNPTHDLWLNNEEFFDNGKYFTEMIAEHTIEYVRKCVANDQPFFLYLPFNAPHYPMHAPQKYVDRFPTLSPDRRIMAAMISAVDDAVGAIMDELRSLGVADDTFTFFTSDNGPSRESRNWLDGNLDPYYGGSSGGLKGHKFSLFEGGIRMPALCHYPAGMQGGRVVDEPCASMDILPTMLTLAGADVSQYDFDGRTMTPLLIDQTPLPQRDLFWEMNDQTAMRRGSMKLVLNGRLVEHEGPVADAYLSDLDADQSEATNLAADQPGVTTDMQQAASAWREKLEARWDKEYAGNYKLTGQP